MIIDHSIINYFDKFFLYLGKFYYNFNLFNRNEIRILTYHDIEKKYEKKFFTQLKSLKKNWNFISTIEFEEHLSKKKILKGKNLLITFDDGFKSNYLIANKILNRFKIKAIFFVPSEFIKIKSKIKSKNFVKQNILDRSYSNDNYIPSNMSMNNLKSLLKLGHTIGCHTKSHKMLSEIKDIKEMKHEVLDSAKYLENALNITIKHFAYTYGNFKSINNLSLKVSLSKFNFIYSSFRGNNYNNKNKTIIKRDTVYLDKKNNLLLIFLSGLFDLTYLFQIKSINKLIKKIIKQ
jgi:peptidoglycan/xylan/chitin deacetylase (PgdA/CDA1 family)